MCNEKWVNIVHSKLDLFYDKTKKYIYLSAQVSFNDI